MLIHAVKSCGVCICNRNESCACLPQENEEEWYLWFDIDTVIIDVRFKLPFERFEGKDFITWGNSSRILAGDPLQGTEFHAEELML